MGTVLKGFFVDKSSVFLQRRFNFLVIVAVLLTTLFGWFNPNSWVIILLAACRLLDGNPVERIKTAFSSRLFLVYFVFFLIDAAGFLHTHNLSTQGKVVAKEATLVAIAFVFCAGPFADQRTYRQLITAYSLLLLGASLYCLSVATRAYLSTRDADVFFYHTLTAPISQNAVFFSVFVLSGIVFLLSSGGEPVIGGLSPAGRKVLRYALVCFFVGIMVLLSSRLLLVMMLLILINIFARRYSYRKNKRAFFIIASVILLAVSLLALVNNPIRDRFREATDGNISLVKQDSFKSYMHFSSTELRLLQWRFALQILNARHAWLFGVSPGDNQDLLDQKYIGANMYVGNPKEGPNRHIRGFLGFNFHNQYLETLVRTGLVGLLSLVVLFAVLFRQAWKSKIKEAWFVVLTIAIFFIPEAPLTMQSGVFLFCFFPLLALSRPGVVKNANP